MANYYLEIRDVLFCRKRVRAYVCVCVSNDAANILDKYISILYYDGLDE